VAEATNLLRRFLFKHPEGENKPIVYYYLGLVYMRAKMYPEGFSYWKIVLEDFPDSKAALDTINTINEIDRKGMKNDMLVNFLNKTPDNYLGHTLAWVFLAQNSLKEGNTKDVEDQLSFIESNKPELFIDVPILYSLKGDLLYINGDIEGARDNWVKYANLIDNKKKRIAVFFNVGKALMDKNPSESKRYFLLVRNIGLESPEGFSTNFKISKLNLIQEKSLEGLVEEKREPLDYARLQDRLSILEKSFPGHPLKTESFFDYMDILSLNDRVFESFKVMDDFIGKNTFDNNEIKKQLLSVIVNNLTALQSKDVNMTILKDINGKLLEIRGKLKNIFGKIPDEAENGIFNSFIRELKMIHENNLNLETIEKTKQIQRDFPEKKQEMPYNLAKSALLKYDEALIDDKPLQLLNFHYNNKDTLEFFNSPEHLAFVGSSWVKLGVSEQAQINFYDSYTQKPDSVVLAKWGDAAFKSMDFMVTKSIINTYENNYSNKTDDPDFMWLKYRFSHRLKKWDDFFRVGKNIIDKNLAGQFEPDFSNRYLDGSIQTAKWNEAKELYKKIESNLTEPDKKMILRKWGDYALLNNNIEESLRIYENLTAISDKEPKDMVRYFMALRLKGSQDKLLEGLKNYDVKDGFWKDTLDTIRSDEEKLRELSGKKI
jgi:tetratricopeptide (TPR) repeat protein